MPPRRGRLGSRGRRWSVSPAPESMRLYRAVDHGAPIRLRLTDFAPPSRSGGWGTFAESFLRLNERALTALDVSARIAPGSVEPTVELVPGGRAGAIPLRSAQSGRSVAGLLVQPRFGWS